MKCVNMVQIQNGMSTKLTLKENLVSVLHAVLIPDNLSNSHHPCTRHSYPNSTFDQQQIDRNDKRRYDPSSYILK